MHVAPWETFKLVVALHLSPGSFETASLWWRMYASENLYFVMNAGIGEHASFSFQRVCVCVHVHVYVSECADIYRNMWRSEVDVKMSFSITSLLDYFWHRVSHWTLNFPFWIRPLGQWSLWIYQSFSPGTRATSLHYHAELSWRHRDQNSGPHICTMCHCVLYTPNYLSRLLSYLFFFLSSKDRFSFYSRQAFHSCSLRFYCQGAGNEPSHTQLDSAALTENYAGSLATI